MYRKSDIENGWWVTEKNEVTVGELQKERNSRANKKKIIKNRTLGSKKDEIEENPSPSAERDPTMQFPEGLLQSHKTNGGSVLSRFLPVQFPKWLREERDETGFYTRWPQNCTLPLRFTGCNGGTKNGAASQSHLRRPRSLLPIKR